MASTMCAALHLYKLVTLGITATRFLFHVSVSLSLCGSWVLARLTLFGDCFVETHASATSSSRCFLSTPWLRLVPAPVGSPCLLLRDLRMHRSVWCSRRSVAASLPCRLRRRGRILTEPFWSSSRRLVFTLLKPTSVSRSTLLGSRSCGAGLSQWMRDPAGGRGASTTPTVQADDRTLGGRAGGSAALRLAPEGQAVLGRVAARRSVQAERLPPPTLCRRAGWLPTPRSGFHRILLPP